MNLSNNISPLVTTITLNDISISFGLSPIEDQSIISIQREKNNNDIHLFFALKGESSLIVDEQKSIKFDCNHYNILFIPSHLQQKLKGTSCDGCTGCNEWSFFEITFSSDHFEKYLNIDNDVFKQFQKNINEKKAVSFCPNNLRTSRKSLEIIDSIMNCELQGIYKNLFLQSQIYTLIALQLEQVEHFECPALTTLKKMDVDKMYQVRDFLHCNYEKSCPLADLALHVGTNECTLKKGFKEIFGCTVYNYLSNLRMMHAKEELENTERSITEIAEEIGYKNATHFTAAFKKKFGVLPSKLRD